MHPFRRYWISKPGRCFLQEIRRPSPVAYTHGDMAVFVIMGSVYRPGGFNDNDITGLTCLLCRNFLPTVFRQYIIILVCISVGHRIRDVQTSPLECQLYISCAIFTGPVSSMCRQPLTGRRNVKLLMCISILCFAIA